MLQHPRFVSVFPSVYRLATTTLSPSEWIGAATLTLPHDASVSHQSRLVRLGLIRGDLFPIHFTIGRDLHLPELPDIFLHRTVQMPHHTEHGVNVATAVIGSASMLRLLDVVVVIDWLLHREHLRPEALHLTLEKEHWRPGVEATREALPLIDRRSASVKESEVRCFLVAAGLPAPEPNVDLFDEDGTFVGRGDLVYRGLRLVIEYEGLQHAFDVRQFEHDVGRYAGFRRSGLAYVQVTSRMVASPRTLVGTIHRAMVERGYDGPAPRFGHRWRRLFADPPPWRHLKGRA